VNLIIIQKISTKIKRLPVIFALKMVFV